MYAQTNINVVLHKKAGIRICAVSACVTFFRTSIVMADTVETQPLVASQEAGTSSSADHTVEEHPHPHGAEHHRTVCVALDFSTHGRNAVVWTMRNYARDGDLIVLLNVRAAVVPPAPYGNPVFATYNVTLIRFCRHWLCGF